MHYYLCGFVGSGTESDPFRPEVTSAQWSMIDLRGDSSAVSGRCLVSVDARPASDPPSAVYLGTDIDAALGSPTKQRLSQALGIAFDPASENTVRSITTSLLTKYASDTDHTKPNRLRGGRIAFGAVSWAV